jgi:lia operon protein LiaF
MNATTDRPRLLIGLLLVSVGALYLLSNLGILHGFNVWAFVWGIFWLWLGAAVVGPRGRGVGATRLALGLLLIFIGGATLLDGLGLIDFSFGQFLSQFWPVILIGLGVLILIESNRPRTAGPLESSDRIVHDSIFGDFRLRQPGWQLRDARVSTLIGDIKIDLSKATIPEGETTIDLRTLIGDIDVWAPPDLPVALDVQCAFVSLNRFGHKQDVILRRYSDAPAGYEAAPRRVRVHADLIFGDLNLIRAG